MRINFANGYKDIVPNDESYRLRSIMGDNDITLKFSLPDFIEFPLGSFVNYQGQRYTLNSPAKINEVNSTNFEYTLILGSPQDLLRNFKIKDTQGRLKFPITAKPSEHLELLVYNLNQNDSGWSVGACIDKYEKLISYNHTNCYDALQTIASEFKTEFEIVGKTIHLRKVEYNKDNPLFLSYGLGNGFISGVGRQNDDQKAGFNVLYIQGGDRNIDFSKYGNKELLLPKNQRYTYKGVTYQTDAKGLSISVVGDTSVTENRKEESLDLTHIYPQRTGTVSEVITVDEEKNFYDFKDSSIPANLDFSQCRMDGNKITIRFKSGMLAGREFDIQQDDKSLTGYVHAERRFKLVPKEEDGYIMPNETFKPEIGDKYAVFGMMMPNAYICDNSSKTGASWEMFKEACKHFYENHESKFTFKGTLNGIWAKKDWVNIGGRLKLGGFISFSDEKFQPEGINIRITSIKDFLNNPHSPEIELANSVQGGSIATELDKIKENEVVREDLHKRAIDYTKRRFRDAEETMKMLVNSKLNFSKGINPMSVNAMQLLVGDKSLQFRFVNSMVKPIIEVEHSFIYDQKRKVLKTSGGILQHLTLGIDTVKPNQPYKFWNVTAFQSPALTEENKTYYFYIKANKNNQSASFVLSEDAIGLEEVSGYYHLLTGILNSETDGERSFVTMYGFTEILPGQIKAKKWSSGDGRQYIEFLQNVMRIKGVVEFTSDSPALQQTYDQAKSLDDAQIIGGENLLRNYNDLTKWLKEHSVNVATDNEVTITIARHLGVYQNIEVDKNTDYILSFYVDEVTNNCYVGVGGNQTDSLWSGIIGYSQMQNGWNEVKFNSGNSDLVRVYFKISQDTSAHFKLRSAQLEEGNKRTAHCSSLKDVQANIEKTKQEVIQANQNYVNSKNFVTQVTHEADLDGVRTEAEQKAIDEATKKMNLAKAYAVAQDNLLRTQQKAYADGKISQAEQNAINVAQAKSNLAEQRAKAYADGKITAEEQRAIADAQNKLNKAKKYAREQDESIQIGGENLLRNYNDFSKWSKEHDVNITDNEVSILLNDYQSNLGVYQDADIEVNTDYILSFYVENIKGNGSVKFGVGGNNSSSNWSGLTNGYSEMVSGWNEVKFNSGSSTSARVYIAGKGTNLKFKIRSAQLEEGNKRTAHKISIKDIQSEVEKNKQAFDNFKNTTFKAFSDGIIDKPEKEALKLHLKVLNKELGDLSTIFNSIYGSRYTATAYKNTMNASYVAYENSLNSLKSAINNAIGDGKITTSERNAVDNAFRDYPKKLKELRNVLERGTRKIENAVKEEAKAHAKALDDAQVIGGTNLLKNSNKRVSSSSYKLAEYYLTEKIKEGEDVVLTLWGQLGSDRSHFRAYNSGGMVRLSNLKKIKKGVYQAKFQWKNSTPYNGSTYICDDTYIRVYHMYSSGTSVSMIDKIQLEKGNKGTDYSVANEDIQVEINKTKQDTENARQQLAAQIARAKQEAINQAQRAYDKAQKVAEKTDFLNETKIDGNTVATGTMMVGGMAGANSGITGVGNYDQAPRIWAGAKKNKIPLNKNDANFLVTQDGTVYAKQAEISGKIGALSGFLGGFLIKEHKIVGKIGTSIPYFDSDGNFIDNIEIVKDIIEINNKDGYFLIEKDVGFGKSTMKIEDNRIRLKEKTFTGLTSETIIEAGKIKLKDNEGNTKEITASN